MQRREKSQGRNEEGSRVSRGRLGAALRSTDERLLRWPDVDSQREGVRARREGGECTADNVEKR